ncbi:MAG TPA: DUF427 domain-containing protein [Micromonosporaceae bacterium]|nr:DUF427 domain-containing protein [Micromonosporaceae bacterium]
MAGSFFTALWRPRVGRTSRRVVVRHRGQTVADSARCWRVTQILHAPVHYVPRAEVAGALAPSARRTYCPYKGVASYWDLHVGDAVVRDAAWSYGDPKPGYVELRGAVAFDRSKVDEYAVGPARAGG